MRKLLNFACGILAILSLAGCAGATTYTLGDLNDLDHGAAYAWGTTFTLQSNEEITGATIVIHNIANWQAEPNVLYVDLLDSPPAIGTKAYSDNQSVFSDYFAGKFGSVSLAEKHNLSTTPQDITLTFTDAQLKKLTSFIQNGGSFGLGFDPDCHFYNDGITFTITTIVHDPPPEVPEPSTVVLLGSGLIGLACIARRFKK